MKKVLTLSSLIVAAMITFSVTAGANVDATKTSSITIRTTASDAPPAEPGCKHTPPCSSDSL